MEKEILNCKEKYPKRALLIINPVSGKKLVIRYIPDIIRRLMDSGYLVTTAVTSCRGEATEIAAQLGISRSYVSRIEKKALATLQQALEAQEG